MLFRNFMKLTIFLLFLLSLTSTSRSQSMFSTIHLNEERDVHTGIPKSIKQTTVFYTSKGIEKKKELTEYDKSGLPASKTFFDENEIITSQVGFTYDTIKRVILESKTTNVKAPISSYGV